MRIVEIFHERKRTKRTDGSVAYPSDAGVVSLLITVRDSHEHVRAAGLEGVPEERVGAGPLVVVRVPRLGMC